MSEQTCNTVIGDGQPVQIEFTYDPPQPECGEGPSVYMKTVKQLNEGGFPMKNIISVFSEAELDRLQECCFEYMEAK